MLQSSGTPGAFSFDRLSHFLASPAVAVHRHAPVNAPGHTRVMFAVCDINETLARLGKHGAQLVGGAPEGLLIGLAQELGWTH
ncbi:MAG TPA: hypothetical protein VN577_01510 [Terriglobales bacterium]|nr:hypothetical protein [Terriglobales bacterium]